MPRSAMLVLLFTIASIGLPGTSDFVGEFLALAGTYQISTWAAALCTTGIILGAAYMLYLYRRIAFGEIVHDDVRAMRSEEHTSELQSLMRISYAVFCLKKKKLTTNKRQHYRSINKQAQSI